jgi:hypothetical protein
MGPTRSTGPRVLFLAAAMITCAIILWARQWQFGHSRHGLSASFFVLFTYEDLPGAVCALLILLGALVGSRYLHAAPIMEWAGDHPRIIAAFTALSFALGALVIYRDHPLSMDEYAAYFQGRVFASGQLHGTFPAPLLDWLIPPGFQGHFLNVSRITGSVAESYWPGFALLLAPFAWAGAPWLCNPIISALTLLVVHRLALEMFGDRAAAGCAVLLTIASPVIFANGISYYSMPAHLLANSLFGLLLIRPTLPRAAVAGVVGSFALILHNPVPHMLFAVPFLAWTVARPGGLRLAAALAVGYLPLCALLGVGWFLFSGHLLHEGLAAASVPVASAHRLQGMLSIFSLPDSTIVLARLVGIAKTWVWAVPGLLILAAAGAIRRRHDPLCRLLAASALLTVLGYLLVPVDQGHGWGYRYFHSAWMALPLLATAALFQPAGVPAHPGSSAPLFENGESKDFVAACMLLTLVFGTGLRAWQMHDFIARNMSQAPHYDGTGKRVTIIDGTDSFYGADLVQNDPWLRGDEIRMYSHGRVRDEQMMAQFFPALHQVYADVHGTVWTHAGDDLSRSGLQCTGCVRSSAMPAGQVSE